MTLDMLPTENRITTIPENFGDARAHETAFLFNSCGMCRESTRARFSLICITF